MLGGWPGSHRRKGKQTLSKKLGESSAESKGAVYKNGFLGARKAKISRGGDPEKPGKTLIGQYAGEGIVEVLKIEKQRFFPKDAGILQLSAEDQPFKLQNRRRGGGSSSLQRPHSEAMVASGFKTALQQHQGGGSGREGRHGSTLVISWTMVEAQREGPKKQPGGGESPWNDWGKGHTPRTREFI